MYLCTFCFIFISRIDQFLKIELNYNKQDMDFVQRISNELIYAAKSIGIAGKF